MTRFRQLAAVFALVVAGLVAHAGGLANGFVWDDEQIIVNNPLTRDLSRIGEVLLSPDEFRPFYRPLNRASYLIDYQLFGLAPLGFHAVNLLIHLGNVVLLFFLAKRLLRAQAPAVLAALLLAVHPVGVEAVALVSARNNLLALLFSLAALLLFIDAERKLSSKRAWLSGLVFFLALMSKEPAAMVLPIIVAWSVVPGWRSRPFGRAAVGLLVPQAAAAVVYLSLRTVSLGAALASPDAPVPLLARLQTNLYLVPRYLGLVFFPRDLTIFHELPAQPLAPLWVVPAWVAIVAVAGLLLWRSTRASSLGLLWFGLNLLPIAQIVAIPSNTPMAERYFYIPAVGLWLIAADGVERLRSCFSRPAILVAGSGAALVALTVTTIRRTRDWADDLTLARSAVAVDGRSIRARFNLGVVLKDRGDLEAARHEWEAALAIDPHDAGTLTQLATAAAVSGDLKGAERLYREALRSDPALAEAYLNLGKICDRTERPGEALGLYRRFLQLAGPAEEELARAARERVQSLDRSATPGGLPR